MQKGLIIKHVTNTYYIKSENTIYEGTARGKFKQTDLVPTVGDNVEIEVLDKEKKTAVIENIIERKNIINRPKVANITHMICVVSTKLPKPDLLMLDKQLIMSEFMNITSIIVVNKKDLDEEKANDIQRLYSNIGYEVIMTNALNGEGIKEIAQKATLERSNQNKNSIIVLAGNSGVGKSSIINSILNKEVSKAGEISGKNKRGKNTTTITSLYELEENVYLVDTPGFSTLDINEIESRDLDKYFIEFREYIDECEYQGCSHIKEENCGIKKALKEGKISQERYDRYKRLYEEGNGNKKW